MASLQQQCHSHPNIQHPYIVLNKKTAATTGPVQTHPSQARTPPSPPPLPSLLYLPMTYTPSFGAGCYGNHWHAPSRSSPDRAGNYDIAGSGSGSPSYSQYGSRSTRPGERLQGGEAGSDKHTCRWTNAGTQTAAVVNPDI